MLKRVEFNVAKIVKLNDADIVAYARFHLPEYTIAIEHGRRRIIVAWYNGISMHTEGLIDDPSILVSALGKVLG